MRLFITIEFDEKSYISNELSCCIEQVLHCWNKSVSSRAAKKLSALEKECGTANTIEALETENYIYTCGVRDFLTADDDNEDGTFEYICEFAHNLKKYGTLYKRDEESVT